MTFKPEEHKKEPELCSCKTCNLECPKCGGTGKIEDVNVVGDSSETTG